MMDKPICSTCGTQFATLAPPLCPICAEERQFVPATGQAWTTLARLRHTHMASFRYENGVLAIGSAPSFGIGQRALLVPTPQGNVLWDCISFIDAATVDLIGALGGLSAIAISHPHYYTTMLEWSRAFGGVPIYLHAADRQWVMDDGPEIVFWEQQTRTILPGLTLIRTGGHFEGGQILHWAAGAGGKGALMSGDVLQVAADRAFVAFMRSYPNFIPLGAAAVRAIAAIVEPWPFDAIYGAFWDRVIATDAKRAFAASVARHLHWVEREA
jgi:hypothetical protein